uniref:LisH domain-containing protein FOPNL isoform X2 n=1 Tax=Geotrypetes seraphini TaxID=260995 RepID=A0A6P8SJ49_GEOSA|nr:lisH domain-containing protein FOPNL isoform X2 [Geotrypetes seraphini]
MATVTDLKAESGQPEVPLDRQFLIHELNIVEDPNRKAIPLLYGILSQFLHGNREEKVCSAFQKGSVAQNSRTHLGRETNKNVIDDFPDGRRMAASSNTGQSIVRGPYR